MTGLDVLILESRHGAAKHHAEALREAGHHVHLCHDAGSFDFPCRAITEGDACPLDAGVDVALVVRRGVNPKPTSLEQGVTCAIRAGVPLVEDGPTVLDPFEPFLTLRVTGGIVSSVETAIALSDEQLTEAIRVGATPTLARVGVATTDLSCRFTREGTHLRVEIDVPEEAMAVDGPLAVRVLDVMRKQRRTHDQIDVVFRHNDLG